MKKIIVIFLIVIILFSFITFFIFLPREDLQSELFISKTNFVLTSDQRIIEMVVENNSDKKVELQQLEINKLPILTWSPQKITLEKGEDTNITVYYHWFPEEYYYIDVFAFPEVHGQIEAISPAIDPNVTLRLGDIKVEEKDDKKLINVPYEIDSVANEWIHVLLFTYRSYDVIIRPIYVFYDPVFMAPKSVQRASEFTDMAMNYGIYIQKINYTEMEIVVQNDSSSILIFFEPLMNWQGKEVHDALPDIVLDPDDDGRVIDDSIYNKSLLYDLMHDNGLILVTIGSTQPHKYILYSDGRVNFNKDSFKWNDASFFLTSVGMESELIIGNFGIGDYTPTRITSSLGITRWWSLQGFDKDSMINEGLEFYSYGDYNLLYLKVERNLTLPVFIKVGKGGWLALGDDYNQLSDEIVIHDLIMILLHATWNSNWIPYGWYWDSSANFHQTQGGLFSVNGNLNTEEIPRHIIDGLKVRILVIAYNSDYNKISLLEELIYLEELS